MAGLCALSVEHMNVNAVRLPAAPSSIRKGEPLKTLLGAEAVACLAHNLRWVYPDFAADAFQRAALHGLEPLELLDRGRKLADDLRAFLPPSYAEAVAILQASLTPPLPNTEGNGLAVFFYLPHVSFVARHGLLPSDYAGADPFPLSMQLQYELTRRFSAEFSIRPFLDRYPERTLAQLHDWLDDPCPHVRRLCSEGTRPRLPWAMRLPRFVADPSPVLPLLERLRDDPSLYVRRSVANHLGDIAKDHPQRMLDLCADWLPGASRERRWLLRHALRYLARKGDARALQLRLAAA